MYVEICHDLTDRNKFVPAGNIQPINRETECYISLFPFEESILNYVKTHGTIKEHKGKHFCNYILIDVDNESDIISSQQSAIEVIKRLNSKYNINPDELFIYYSGCKGFHIVIFERFFGKLEPNENMAQGIKLFVAEFAQGIQNIDIGIYENHRIIRVENSKHRKTGLYKTQISFAELQLPIEEIKNISSEHRIFKRIKPIDDIQLNANLQRDLLQYVNRQGEKINYKEQIRDGFFSPPSGKGERNNVLFKQAAMLFNLSDLGEKSVFEIINSINLASPEPLSQNEIRTIVKSASAKKRIVESENEEIECKTVGELIPEWIANLAIEKNKISLLFPSLDNEFKGKLRGKLGVFIGYGGTKKSLLAQNIAVANIMAFNRTLYSNMEMSNIELLSRFIDIVCQGEHYNASIDLENIHRQGGDVLPFINENIVNHFNDKVLISSTPSMTAEKYDKLIEISTQKTGKIDCLIVDGLSMMGGKGTETEKANEHSQKLKELAKKWNILILLIVHASKGENLETRDLGKKARSSEKIIDNCDFYGTTSLIKACDNEFNSTFGAFHLWNKRGSGNRVEKAFEILPLSLQLQETHYSIKDIENKTNDSDAVLI